MKQKGFKKMKFKEIIITKANETFKRLVNKAVNYAEDLLGSGTGAAKKELAIDFLLSKLPIYLKPIIPFFKQTLIKLADTLIEKAVKRMQQIQGVNGGCGA